MTKNNFKTTLKPICDPAPWRKPIFNPKVHMDKADQAKILMNKIKNA